MFAQNHIFNWIKFYQDPVNKNCTKSDTDVDSVPNSKV